MFHSLEVIPRLTKFKIQQLKKVDYKYLKNLLHIEGRVAKAYLHLETNTIPLGWIIKERRLGYLKTILDNETDSLVKRVYKA